jgi:Rho-binding antiterminator
MEDKPYQPIDCNLYDYLEEAATLKKKCVFLISVGGDLRIVNGQIVDLFIRDKVEYLKLKKGTELRLDSIKQFNDIDFRTGKVCKL